jgi:NitT/TauT family transport system substrate-binding protein
MEALLAGSIDLTYVGPNPALNAYISSEGDEVRISRRGSGGAASSSSPTAASRRTPTSGQAHRDAAARQHAGRGRARVPEVEGLQITQTGGDALVLPTANADQLTLFQKGDLDAVWTVEPWVTRLVLEAKGKVYLDERDLWPETAGHYVTTHLVSAWRS